MAGLLVGIALVQIYISVYEKLGKHYMIECSYHIGRSKPPRSGATARAGPGLGQAPETTNYQLYIDRALNMVDVVIYRQQLK
jgi:hypothetical protein